MHDSKFPGDEVPPLPHSSTWFSHLEDTNGEAASSDKDSSRQNIRTRNQPRAPSPADSDDIAIERERISLKCPLTLLSFQDPVTSTKCPHSFEREAITDMISRSSRYAPDPARRGRRLRAVKCPVCSNLLTMEDLRTDAALLRKVRRAEEMQAREADDRMEGSGRRRGANEVTLGSDEVSGEESDSDAMDVDVDDADSDRPRIKSEPRARIKRESMIPNASQQVEMISSEEGEEEDSD